MAVRVGFEPTRRYHRPTPLAGEPLQPLGYCSIWRKWRDLNPHRAHHATLVFKTSRLPISVHFHNDYCLDSHSINSFFFFGIPYVVHHLRIALSVTPYLRPTAQKPISIISCANCIASGRSTLRLDKA